MRHQSDIYLQATPVYTVHFMKLPLTLPKSNPLGLKKYLQLREISTYAGSKTIEIRKRGLEIDLRLRRLFHWCDFDFGRVNCSLKTCMRESGSEAWILALQRQFPIPFCFTVLLDADRAGPMGKRTIWNLKLWPWTPSLVRSPTEPVLFAFSKTAGVKELGDQHRAACLCTTDSLIIGDGDPQLKLSTCRHAHWSTHWRNKQNKGPCKWFKANVKVTAIADYQRCRNLPDQGPIA